jgi:hypothetical protein
MGKVRIRKLAAGTLNDCGDEIDILNRLASLIKEQMPAGKLQPTNSVTE